MKRVLFLDDCDGIHKFLQDCLKSTPEIELVSVLTIEDFRKRFAVDKNWDFIIIDACVPGYSINTMEVVKEIRAGDSDVPILAVSASPFQCEGLINLGCIDGGEKKDLPKKIIQSLE